MLFLLPFVFTSYSHCGNKVGTYIHTFKVHVDTAALIKLRTMLSYEFSSDFNTMSAAMKFFGGVFDMANEILEPYGVQLRADLSKLRIESFNVSYDQGDCENDVANYRTALLQNTFDKLNRLILFYCKSEKRSKSILMRSCESLIGITLYNLKDLAQDMVRELIKAVSRDLYMVDGIITESFNASLCSQARKCMKYEIGVKNVRHLAAETYLSGNRYQIREHDMYDDVSDNQGGDPDIFATQDYSNDNELFEDYKKAKKGMGQIFNKPF